VVSGPDGHTKKRPGQPETAGAAREPHGAARDRPGTGNNARHLDILFKSIFCRNYNGI
jgi:hypothetical protein